ncbi:hypothetical protein [Micromonospora carbonacea]|uniref:Uncharacterized protein n=1 Tax=Micromonospora carbonacea TaxID=47853 RepID=A0A7H8XS76_9ACTN|nr:hypothetical protein [Micromonospora carbonacea]MBB5823878.1 hypothetical protein [Micromonospora carbonacea]QLD27846.1 hypothetical protein HXZ27_29535 [Micromonospora carbonacea]
MLCTHIRNGSRSATLAAFPSVTPAWDLLTAVAELGVDVGPYLAGFADGPGDGPARHLAEVIGSWSSGGSLPDGAEESMRRWLAGPTPVDVLWTAVGTSASPEVVAELTDAADAFAYLARRFARAAEHAHLLRGRQVSR